MYEVACEPSGNCDTDQQSFKAYLSRWMAASTKVAPFVSDLVSTLLTDSAAAAAKSCTGGDDGVTCGTKWTTGTWDNTWGVGQQMNALEVIQGLLIDQVSGPVSNLTGGISQGDPSAGTGGDSSPGAPTKLITTGDRAGAGILTAIILVALLGGAWYVIFPPYKPRYDLNRMLTFVQVDGSLVVVYAVRANHDLSAFMELVVYHRNRCYQSLNIHDAGASFHGRSRLVRGYHVSHYQSPYHLSSVADTGVFSVTCPSAT